MATMTPAPDTDYATRLCPVCADDRPAEPCDNCGWERGLILAYQKDVGDMMEVGFSAEKRHK